MMKFHVVSAVCILLLTTLTLTQGQVVNTINGPVQGKRISVQGTPVDVFLGIPFAKPPVGNLRFKYPQPFDSWGTEIRSAENLAPSCIQPPFPFPEPHRNLPNYFSEDCLHLNVWKPTNLNTKLPVMVWLYGGSFNTGGIASPLYDGKYYAAKQNVILVSINYRLGPLGFSYLGPDTIKGNMGLMDQRMGLQWIKDNIENFGGDPNLVTIFGESAGSVCVSMHLLSPGSWPFFRRAILQSGAPTASWATMSAAKARSNSAKLAGLLRCSNQSDADIYECFKTADADEMAAKQMILGAGGMAFTPVVDGHFLEEDPKSLLLKKKFKKTEVLHGVTKEEGTFILLVMFQTIFNTSNIPKQIQLDPKLYDSLFDFSLGGRIPTTSARKLFYSSFYNPENNIYQLDVLNWLVSDTEFVCPAVEFGSYASKENTVYMYRFDHAPSLSYLPPWVGATHSSELEFAFGFVLDEATQYTAAERDLATTLMTYWTNFAKTGDPNMPNSLPTYWPPYDDTTKKYLKLDIGNPQTGKRMRNHQCVFLHEILPMIPAKPGTSAPPPDYYCPVSSGTSVCVSMATVFATILTLICSQM